jgi:hypothetical protein
MSQTLGQKRVKADFNPAKNDLVDQIKNKSAELIDLLQTMRENAELAAREKSDSTNSNVSGEKLRVISLAQTAFEEGAMWAVKANFTE